jgi:hypothetical protein
MPLMTTVEAEQLRDEWLPRYSSTAAFEVAWRNCYARFANRTSAEVMARWLREDLVVDASMAAGLPSKEPVLPQRQNFVHSRCAHCKGRHLVGRGLERDEPGFGQVDPCGFCADPEHAKTCAVCQEWDRNHDENGDEIVAVSGTKSGRKRGKKSQDKIEKRDYVGELAKKMRMP